MNNVNSKSNSVHVLPKKQFVLFGKIYTFLQRVSFQTAFLHFFNVGKDGLV